MSFLNKEMTSSVEICEKLQMYYQANLLKNASPEVQNTFKTVAEYVTKSSNGFPNVNKTLIKLIYNYFNKDTKNKIYKIKEISGPHIIHIMRSEKYKKTLVLFGEQHRMINPCKNDMYGKPSSMVMLNYIEDVLRETPVFIDLYLEDDWNFKPLWENSQVSETTLHNLRGGFSNCINRNKKCKWKDISRIHYTDVRGIIDNKEASFSDYFNVVNDLIRGKVTPLVLNWCEEVKDYTQKQYLSYLIKQYSKGNKFVKKELERSTETSRITMWLNIQLEKRIEDTWVENRFKKFLNEYKSKGYLINELFGFVLYPTTLMMDGYVLSRVFKKFKHIDDGDTPQEPTNIIMYAGSAHIKHYVGFLRNNLGFKTIHNTEEDDSFFLLKNCLDMSGVKHPLFKPF
jgi:hypothetical protein